MGEVTATSETHPSPIPSLFDWRHCVKVKASEAGSIVSNQGKERKYFPLWKGKNTPRERISLSVSTLRRFPLYRGVLYSKIGRGERGDSVKAGFRYVEVSVKAGLTIYISLFS